MEKTVITFGRLNPPTVGHEKLVDKVKQLAKRHKAEPHVFLSHSQNAKKDPLNYQQKFRYAKQAFGDVVYRSNSKTIIQIMQELEKMNHSEVIMVVGSDRVQEFRTLLKKYNGKDYTFDKITVVSAGERDPDAEGVTGMSASKMRAAASEGDAAAFMRGVPSKLSKQNAKRMYNDLRAAMNIREDLDNFDWDEWAETVDIDDIEIEQELNEAVLSLQQRIKRARQMKRMAPRYKRMRKIKAKRMADPTRLMQRARKQAIQTFRKRVAGDKGAKYPSLAPAAKITIDKLIQKKMPAVEKLAKRLLPKVRQAEMERLKKVRSPKNEEVAQDKDIKDRQGTQPAKYFKDLAKSTKSSRDAHFKKYAKKDDSDPDNYKPAPGDKSAKTKPSVHTKKYKKMFGESNGQTDDVRDVVPSMMRVSVISSSKKKLLNDKFEKLAEQDSAERTKQRHDAEKQRLKQQHKQEKDRLKQQQGRQMDRAQIRDIRSEEAMKLKQQKASSGIAPRSNYALEEKAIDALKKKAEKSGIPYGTLKRVYDRGMAAWKSGHRPGTTPQQWAFARVNSFVTKGKGTWGGADKDLASKVKKESTEPTGQMLNEDVNTLDNAFGTFMTARDHGIEIQGGFAYHPSVTEEGGAGEFGTDELTKKYKKETPGQEEHEENKDDEV